MLLRNTKQTINEFVDMLYASQEELDEEDNSIDQI